MIVIGILNLLFGLLILIDLYDKQPEFKNFMQAAIGTTLVIMGAVILGG